MIHLDELCGWTNKQSQKSEWIIWIDHTNESFEWKWQMVKQTAPSSSNWVKRSGLTPWLTTLKKPNSSQALTIWVLEVGSAKSTTGIKTELVLPFGTGCNTTTMVCFFGVFYVNLSKEWKIVEVKDFEGEGTWWKGYLLSFDL